MTPWINLRVVPEAVELIRACDDGLPDLKGASLRGVIVPPHCSSGVDGCQLIIRMPQTLISDDLMGLLSSTDPLLIHPRACISPILSVGSQLLKSGLLRCRSGSVR